MSKIFFTQSLDMKTDDDVPLEIPLNDLAEGISDWEKSNHIIIIELESEVVRTDEVS